MYRGSKNNNNSNHNLTELQWLQATLPYLWRRVDWMYAALPHWHRLLFYRHRVTTAAAPIHRSTSAAVADASMLRWQGFNVPPDTVQYVIPKMIFPVNHWNDSNKTKHNYNQEEYKQEHQLSQTHRASADAVYFVGKLLGIVKKNRIHIVYRRKDISTVFRWTIRPRVLNGSWFS